MQGFEIQKETGILNNLSIEEQGRLVGAFEWLLKQDKEQNPELYSKNQDDRYSLPSHTER